MSGAIFGIVPAGQQLITEPSSIPSPTSFLYVLPVIKPLSHIMVFLLPNVTLPENSAAAIYMGTVRELERSTKSDETPNFKFLGGIGPGKESALFKLSTSQSNDSDSGGLVLGVSVESADSVGQRLQQLASAKTNPPGAASNTSQPPTSVLAQRIIENAFNFLASFSGSAGPDGMEVIPLKAFEEWWKKFESRIRADPSFLEMRTN